MKKKKLNNQGGGIITGLHVKPEKKDLTIENIDSKEKSLNLQKRSNLCRSNTWISFHNTFIPVLKLMTYETEFIVFWTDEIALKLSKENYCIVCGKESILNTCLTCQEQQNYKKFSCLFTKAGLPFGTPCSKDLLPCEDPNFAENICYDQYILYIGRKNLLWKIGISRKRREGTEDGFLLRIIEQGIEEVVLITSTNNLSLPEAQNLEAKISEELNVPQKFTRNIKADFNATNIVELLSNLYEELKFEIITNLLKIGLFSPWLTATEARKLFQNAELKTLKGGDIINGKILASWGKESIIKAKEKIYRIKRNELVGKRLLPLQEGYWGN